MNNRMALSAALLLGSASAAAGVDVTRMTTVVDDFGGSYTTTTQFRADEGSRSGTSISEYANFRASDDRAGINGTISDTFERSANQSSAIAQGALTLGGNEQTVEITFENLVVTRSGGELTIEGEVTVDDETFSGDNLPDRLRRVLGRLFLRLHR